MPVIGPNLTTWPWAQEKSGTCLQCVWQRSIRSVGIKMVYQHDPRKMLSGITHHKSRLQNMCYTHSWPQQIYMYISRMYLEHCSLMGRPGQDIPCRHYRFSSWGSGERKSEWMGTHGYERMLNESWTNPKCKRSTKGVYRIRIIHTTIGKIKEVSSKRLVRVVQDTFRIGADLNESHWFRIASAYIPCLQGPEETVQCEKLTKFAIAIGTIIFALYWYRKPPLIFCSTYFLWRCNEATCWRGTWLYNQWLCQTPHQYC